MDDQNQKKIERLERLLRDCRNELCNLCGKYEMAHMGACDGCRWKEEYAEELWQRAKRECTAAAVNLRQSGRMCLI